MHLIRVRDLMSASPCCVDYDENMLSAARLLLEKNFKHILVTRNGELVGILSDRDINRAIKADRSHNDKIVMSLSDKTKVKDFMNWPVYTISENATAKFALEQMMLQKVSALVVENTERKITGIITSNDFLGLLLTHMQNEEQDELRP